MEKIIKHSTLERLLNQIEKREKQMVKQHIEGTFLVYDNPTEKLTQKCRAINELRNAIYEMSIFFEDD